VEFTIINRAVKPLALAMGISGARREAKSLLRCPGSLEGQSLKDSAKGSVHQQFLEKLQIGNYSTSIFIPGILNDKQFVTCLVGVQFQNFGQFARTC
jgi:hypothetical protein